MARRVKTWETGGKERTTQLSLLPFLDIVFSAIGIFVVVFALQNIVEARDGTPARIDSIISCIDGKRLTAHWPNGTPGPTSGSAESFELLRELAESERPFRSLMFAMTAACLDARRNFLKGFDRFTEFSEVGDPTAESGPMTVLLEFYPLGDAEDEQRLLEEWRGGPGS